MIPAHWTEYRREEDRETLGYVEVIESGRFNARTLFGFPLGEFDTEADAERILDRIGLSYLAEPWLLTLPERAEPISVQIVEAAPLTLTVQSVDLEYEGDYGTPFILAVPISPDILRPKRPLAV